MNRKAITQELIQNMAFVALVFGFAWVAATFETGVALGLGPSEPIPNYQQNVIVPAAVATVAIWSIISSYRVYKWQATES